MGYGFVSTNSNLLDQSFNSNATVTLKISGCASYTIYKADGFYSTFEEIKQNGYECTYPECLNEICSGNSIIFDVIEFSSYAAEGNARLLTYDNGPVDCYSNVCVYANYTNSSDAMILGADCDVTFDEISDYQMSWNGINDQSCAKSYTSAGNHNYSVLCTHPNYDSVSTNDTVTISGVGCGGEPPGGPIPEFSIIGAILIVIAAILGIVILKKKH